jgi:hypothetical protein
VFRTKDDVSLRDPGTSCAPVARIHHPGAGKWSHAVPSIGAAATTIGAVSPTSAEPIAASFVRCGCATRHVTDRGGVEINGSVMSSCGLMVATADGVLRGFDIRERVGETDEDKDSGKGGKLQGVGMETATAGVMVDEKALYDINRRESWPEREEYGNSKHTRENDCTMPVGGVWAAAVEATTHDAMQTGAWACPNFNVAA